MNVISKLLIQEKDSGVFVFPSEAASVHWRKEFMFITGRKAVRNSRFLSWDSFKEEITLHNREERPVNSVLRKLFAADVIRKNSEGEPLFRKLVPPEYSSQAGAFSDTVYRVLPELQRLIKALDKECGALEPALESDYRHLYDEYLDFMKINKLFEPSWELPSLHKLEKKYFIICPELIEDFDEFAAILADAGCQTVSGGSGRVGTLRVFENSVIEADAVLNEISSLLQQGLSHSDIAVTCADDTTAKELLAKAALRGIPLHFRSGKTLAEYPAGRLPELLRACRSSGYSIAAMKNLLLYRVFIWKEADAASELIRFGIENRCLKNTSAGKSGDIWAARLEAAGRKKLLGFYKILRLRIEAVCRADSFETLAREMQIFIAGFLDTDEDSWDNASEKVFQRSREVLSSLRETESQLVNLSVADPLGLWIELLNEKIYVPQHNEPGIAVYPYRVSALINPEVHFICGLSHDCSSVTSSAFSFLTDQQRKQIDASELNMTSDFISLYGISGKAVRFSSAVETAGGVTIAPGSFIVNNTVEKINYTGDTEDLLFSDPVLRENKWWADACRNAGPSGVAPLPLVSPVQKSGFKYASETFMKHKSFDASSDVFPADFLEKELLSVMNDDEGYYRVSASSLNSWMDCPFYYFLSGPLNVFEDEYILKPEDPMTAGNIMHEILHLFFSRMSEEHASFRSVGRLDEYRNKIRAAAEDVYKRWESEKNYFFGPAWDALKRRALTDLLHFPEAEAEFYDGLAPVKLEQWMDFIIEEDKIRVGGYVDRISADENGAVIVDYKKSWSKQTRQKFISVGEDGRLLPPKIGFQLPIYILLAEAAGMKVAGSSYYGISSACHFPVSGAGGVLSDDDIENLRELTIDSIATMAEAVRGGDFRAPSRCDGCGLRAVCRKRFNVRWNK